MIEFNPILDVEPVISVNIALNCQLVYLEDARSAVSYFAKAVDSHSINR